MNKETAWANCDGIVIHGDHLEEEYKAEVNMADDDPAKG